VVVGCGEVLPGPCRKLAWHPQTLLEIDERRPNVFHSHVFTLIVAQNDIYKMTALCGEKSARAP
jgi:hypothetical protein